MARPRIGVMGGAFDPFHRGHLAAATQAADLLHLDRVIFAPTGQAWHKDAIVADADVRLLMTVAGTADDPRFEVSRVDLDRAGPTYTVDTLTDLRQQRAEAGLPEADWFFITGADAAAGFLSWRDPQQILEQAHLVVVTRPGHDLAVPGVPPERVILQEIPGIDLSSTQVRERVARGESIDDLVPAAVAEIIRAHGLYA